MRAYLKAGDVEVAQATALRLRIADRPPPDAALPDPSLLPTPVAEAPPVDSERVGVGVAGRVYFHRHGVEMRQAEGEFDQPGPGGGVDEDCRSPGGRRAVDSPAPGRDQRRPRKRDQLGAAPPPGSS